MENLLYVTLTNIVCLVSLIGTITLILIFIFKKSFNFPKIALFLLFLAGLYLYIPMKYVTTGYIWQKPEKLQKALGLSINPYEKRLCYKYLAEIYADDIYYQGIKDGTKAIEYMELALKGKYSKYKEEAGNLAFWYSIKGDKEKTFEIADSIKENGIQKRNIYIMEGDYKKALETFSNDEQGIENYLIADLYKKTGNMEASKKAKEIADKKYESVLKNIKIRARKLEFKESADKYKSVEAYKDWILAQRKEYGFE